MSVRSCLERSTYERFAPERSFPFRDTSDKSTPARLMFDKSFRSNKLEFFKSANANRAPSIFVFLKLVLLRSVLSKIAFCMEILSKDIPDKFEPTA